MNAVKWLCASPRRLALAVILAIAVALAGGVALGLTGSTPTDPPQQAGPSIPAQVPAAAPYVSAAVLFVQLWSQLQPGETQQRWASLLGPVTTPELGAALRATDPANLPGVPQQGMPVVVSIAQTTALIAVPLADRSSVLVTVVDEGPRLLVFDVQPNAGDS